MILPPSPARADNTIDGLEYASEVTQVQWKAYVMRNAVMMNTTPVAFWWGKKWGTG